MPSSARASVKIHTIKRRCIDSRGDSRIARRALIKSHGTVCLNCKMDTTHFHTNDVWIMQISKKSQKSVDFFSIRCYYISAVKKRMLINRFALLAQLDRVFGYEPKGQGFESLAARQRTQYTFCALCSFFVLLVFTQGIRTRKGLRRKKRCRWHVFGAERLARYRTHSVGWTSRGRYEVSAKSLAARQAEKPWNPWYIRTSRLFCFVKCLCVICLNLPKNT